jgi:hypothetical protein
LGRQVKTTFWNTLNFSSLPIDWPLILTHCDFDIELVGGLEHFLCVHMLGIVIPTQLTNIFQRGWNHQPVFPWFFPRLRETSRCLFFEVKISSKIQFFERSRETSLHKAAGSFYSEEWNF